MFELHWTEYLKAIGPTLIAIFIAYVAFQQWQVNRANLREKLFERRFAVFKQTQVFLSSVMRDAAVSDKALGEFHDGPQIARFLFGRDVQNYLFEIRKRAMSVRKFSRKMKTLQVGDHLTEVVNKEEAELDWLLKQLDVVFDKFEPYLGFEKHK